MTTYIPRISVIIPVKDGAEFISAAIESVLNQTFKEFEILVMNDGSSDASASIVESYAKRDDRVLLVNPKGSGFATVLNEGMSISRAKYIARLDSDDEMLPGRLAFQYHFLEKNTELDLMATHVNYIDKSGRRIGKGGSPYHTPDEIRAELEKEIIVGFHHPSVIFRRDVVRDLGGYRNDLWPVEDIDLWTRMADSGCNLLVSEEVFTNYRIHQGAGSRSYESIIKLDWVKARILARRGNRQEPTWDEFVQKVHQGPVLMRLSYRRKVLGKYLYRRASQDWLGGSRFKAMTKLSLAFLLSPSHIYKRMRKFRRS